MENNESKLKPSIKVLTEKRELLKNEFFRTYILGASLSLSLFFYFTTNKIAWWAGLLPVMLFALFLRDSTLSFLFKEIGDFKVKFTIYCFCLLFFIVLSFFTDGTWPVLIMIFSLMWFYFYFEKIWKELQEKYDVKQDEWFRK